MNEFCYGIWLCQFTHAKKCIKTTQNDSHEQTGIIIVGVMLQEECIEVFFWHWTSTMWGNFTLEFLHAGECVHN